MNLHTPTFFTRILPFFSGRDIVQVMPAGERGWNSYLHATKNGCPYMVVEHHGVRFSISRVRKSRHEQWSYLLRWPFPADNQDKLRTRDVMELVNTITRRNDETTKLETKMNGFEEFAFADELSPRDQFLADNSDLIDWLAKQDWSDFAKSLAQQARDKGFLSPKQIAAANSMKKKCV